MKLTTIKRAVVLLQVSRRPLDNAFKNTITHSNS